MKLLGGAALVAAAISLASTPAAAGALCSGEASCKTSCDDGNGLACRELGRMYAAGDGVEPDHGAAAEAWGKGCAKDARSCYQLSLLQRTGWTLEVPRDQFASDEKLAAALDAAVPACDTGTGDACLTAALALRERLERDGWPKDQKDRAADVVARGKKACDKGVTDACLFLRRDLWTLANNELIDSKSFNDILELASKRLLEQCKDGNGDACYESAGSIFDEKLAKSVVSAIDKACEDGKARACLAKALVLVSQAGKPEPDDPSITVAIALLIDACGQTATDLCSEFGIGMIKDSELEKLGAHDPAKAIKILRFQCSHGQRAACYDAGKQLEATKPKDAATLLDRSCKLTDPERPCDACVESPELGECKARETWGVSVQCTSGNLELCETLGDRYRGGEGVAVSSKDAAQSYKFACDASIKSACGKLDDVCHADGTIGSEVCAPSLLHTDVFYEAEWQLRVNQSATLSAGAATVGGIPTVTVGGAATASGGVTVQRGKLDADLVVSVVLDRARQAAVKLVVEELESKMRRRGLRTYMRDLLEQGASLLADTTSLRRDALQDLGMTLVRAFAASNLVRTVLGDVEAVKAAPTIGAIVKSWKKKGWLAGADGHVAPDLEAYLADLAYWALGAEPLFQRVGAADDPAPTCPFSDDRKKLCDAITTRAEVTAALRIDGVLTALNMVRALGSAGGIDVRRLIEAIVQSTSIVDFASTPGLNINSWQSRIVDDLRTRFATLRDRLSDLQRLTNPKTYDADGPDLASLARQARLVKAWLRSEDARSLVGEGVATELAGVLVMEKFAGSQLTPAPDQLTTTRADAIAALDRLGTSWRAKLGKKVSPVYDKIDKVAASIDDLGRDIEAIRAALDHHQKMGNDAHAHLTIDDVPLGDLDELLAVFPKVVEVLDALDTGVRDVLPGVDLRGVRFARSSVVRLLGFLDLMSRVARSVRLTQTVKQVVETLALLGRWKDGEFSAPLYDMLAPVLDVIETRNPMPLEQLFAIVGRVRLDSLVTSLIQDDPCAREDRAECWVFKIAYSLQEAITRDGDSIRIDGAEVAKRLARFGDDFRRREKSRWYFHLTVGVSSMFSTPPDMDGMNMRFTPVIAEQVGFGWASPAFWKDRLTFKMGLSASGILYRMLLDNAESNAVMGNFFVAVDVYDLIEAYAAATVLAYPPDDTHDAVLRPGASFGLSVPLSAYLEKL